MPAKIIPYPQFRGQDLSGKRYGRLIVIRFLGIHRYPSGSIGYCWLCRCDCGKELMVTSARLISGNTSSCGCLHNELLAKMSTTHGHKRPTGTVHHLYYRWYGMIQRCTQTKNRAYKWYGAKGIKVCDRWKDFQSFLDDMEGSYKPGLTIDRKDGTKDYCPDNCRWATWQEQRNNH